ncbi:MAG: DUF3256 family protein [Bacteroidales bacterium]|nr:DUF3256 family protein [Bacteroidales bacterium]
MKRIFCVIMCVCAMAFVLMAKNDARPVAAKHLFIEAPDSIFPSIEERTRRDMIDYYESGYNRPSLNVFEDSSVITCCDSTCIEIKASKVLQYQLSMPAKNLIVLISTHSIPMYDSEIAFYDFEWEKQPVEKYFTAPSLTDWLTNDGKKVRDDVENAVPFIIASYNFDVESGVLTITNQLKDYFGKNTWRQVSKWLSPQLKYKWNGKHFKKQ